MLKTIKEFKELIATIIAILTMVGFNIDDIKDYMYMYNIHIILFVIIMDYIVYKIISKNANIEINKLSSRIDDGHRDIQILTLKTNIRKLMEKTSKFKHIDNPYTIDYYFELKDELIKLKVNSNYEAMIKEMGKKIKRS